MVGERKERGREGELHPACSCPGGVLLPFSPKKNSLCGNSGSAARFLCTDSLSPRLLSFTATHTMLRWAPAVLNSFSCLLKA